MASISSLGIGSGLDIKTLVSNLVEAEGAAKTARFDRKQAESEAKLSLYSTVNSALSSFQSTFTQLRFTSSFNAYTATSSDEGVFTATAKTGAETASYDVEVNQLAQAQKLTSAAFADKNSSTVGIGTLVINYGTYAYDGAGAVTGFTPDASATSKEIDITNGTLEGIRDSINAAGVGAKASIIKDPATGYKLVLTSDTGEKNAINLTIKAGTDSDGNDEDNSGLSQLAYDPTNQYAGVALNNLTESQKALSADVTIDGVAITSESNTISDVIDRVTIELKSVSTSTESLTLSRNTAGVKEAIQGFVDGYNELIKTINSATFYDPEKKEAGILIGDATVRGVVSQIRNVLNTPTGDPQAQYNSFASIGILTKRDGSLEINSGSLLPPFAKLDAALADKPDEVKDIFAGGRATSNSSDFTIEGITDNITAGSHSVSIDGTQGTYTGASYFDASTSLDFTALVNFKINVDGIDSGIISLSTNYNLGRTGGEALTAFLADLKNKINTDSALVAANTSVTVSAEQDAATGFYRLKILSDKVGTDSSVTVTQAAAQVGLTAVAGVAGTGTGELLIGGLPATLKDGVLTGSGIYAGFQLRLTDSFAGDLVSSIQVSNGSVSGLNTLINSLLDSDGLLSAKTDGLNTTLDEIVKSRTVLADRLKTIEARYLKQFSAMDALVAQLNSTGSFLTNQLENLPGSSN